MLGITFSSPYSIFDRLSSLFFLLLMPKTFSVISEVSKKSNLNKLMTKAQKNLTLEGKANANKGRWITSCNEDIRDQISFRELPVITLRSKLRVKRQAKEASATF